MKQSFTSENEAVKSMKAVYATDLSAPSEACIRSETCTEGLRSVGIDALHLINVIEVSPRSAVAPFNLETAKESALMREKGLLEERGFDVETHVVRGTPYRRINDLAEEVDADMIIAASRGGHGWLERSLIGSTTVNMARTAVCPLLIQRVEERDVGAGVSGDGIFSRVLHPTDFSENALRAYNEFQTIRNGVVEVDLLHVIAAEQKRMGVREAEADERLDELGRQLEEAGMEVDTRIRYGDAVKELLAEEAEFEPSLVLIGSRGVSRLRRLLLGSVSEEFIKRGESNVLLVPPRRGKEGAGAVRGAP
ncbi:MAG: Universal stress protein [Methanonatronarchaeales archaeon]|nr:Universal stress protein [Methanonatronarchaeales archaeon]